MRWSSSTIFFAAVTDPLHKKRLLPIFFFVCLYIFKKLRAYPDGKPKKASEAGRGN